MRMLGFGLNRALAQGVAHDSARPSALEGSLSLSDSLQQHILEFTKRLHMAEVERRDLRLQVRECHRCFPHLTQLHYLFNSVSAQAPQAATQTSGGERIQREVSQQSTNYSPKKQKYQYFLSDYFVRVSLQRDSLERSRFEQVCGELERALRREQEAQHLLNEQNMRIQQLSLRFNAESNLDDIIYIA